MYETWLSGGIKNFFPTYCEIGVSKGKVSGVRKASKTKTHNDWNNFIWHVAIMVSVNKIKL